MNFMYPVKVAKETAEMGFRMEFLEPHGPGIVSSCLFDLSSVSHTRNRLLSVDPYENRIPLTNS